MWQVLTEQSVIRKAYAYHNEKKSVFEQEESDSEIEDSEKCTDKDEVMPAFGNIFEFFKLLFVKLE